MRLNAHVTLTLDVAEWMRQTSRFDRVRATSREWVQATCPFHDDRHPSFAVNVETGAFRCQACGASGGFVKLVHHVEAHDTMYDAEQSLIARYGKFAPDVNEPLTLDFGDAKGEEETFVQLPQRFMYDSPYLTSRGISREIIDLFGASESSDGKSLMLPWSDGEGRCITVKHRSLVDKRFWYEPTVSPGRLRRHLYGWHVYRHARLMIVCEGEIDALSIATAGHGAVALGGASISDLQAALLRNSAADEIVVFTDNDEAGRKARAAIVAKLVDHKRVSVVDWSLVYHAKDANDILRLYGDGTLGELVEHRVPVGLPLTFGR